MCLIRLVGRWGLIGLAWWGWMPALNAAAPGSINRDYLLHIWETEAGLPQISATSIAQTPDGYLWVGTFDGLSRFDGVKFTTYRPSPECALPSSAIVRLYTDRQGALWAGTDRGMAVRRGGIWQALGEPEGWPRQLPKSIAEDKDGTLFATAGTQILKWSGARFEQVPLPERGDDTSTLSLAADPGGAMWVMGDRYLGRFENGRWQQQLEPPAHEQFEGIAPARGGGIWLAESRHIRQWAGGEWKVRFERPDGFDADAPVSLYEDTRGQLWAGGFAKGLLLFRPGRETLACRREEGLSAIGITTVIEDREGNIWAGTGAGGLVRLRPRGFTAYDDPVRLRASLLSSVAEVGPNRWIVGGNGLMPFDGKTFGERIEAKTPQFASHFSVLSVLRDGIGVIWVGLRDAGLFTTDGETVARFDSPLVQGRSILSLFEDSRSRLWIGTDAGLLYKHGETIQAAGLGAGLPAARFHALAEGGDGFIYAAGEGGLFRGAGERFTPVLLDGRPLMNLLCLGRARGSGIWAGTSDGRLLQFKEHWSVFGRESGLPFARVSALIEDDFNHLWLGADAGIARVQLAEFGRDRTEWPLRYQVFGKSDGLSGVLPAERSQPVVCKASDGRLWFATTKGLAVVDPRTAPQNPKPPLVYIDAIWLDGKPQPTRATVAQVIAPPRPRLVEVSFSGISLSAPESLRFQCRVEGLDEDWRDMGGERRLTLRNLPLGRLQVRVRAANSNGIWSESDALLALLVLPSPWETWWFRTGAFFAVAGGVGAQLWRLHAARLRRQSAQALQEAYRLSEGTIDSLSANICVLDEEGRIIGINRAWARFAEQNGCRPNESWRGVNYFEECARASGAAAAEAEAFAGGIRAVLAGQREVFEMEYTCHSPSERRWFVGRVTRFVIQGTARLVIAHEDVTRQKISEWRLEQARQELEQRVEWRTAELRKANELLAAGRERLIGMSLRLVEVQEDERRAIARELHDEVGQILTSLRILLDMSERQPPGSIAGTVTEAKGMAGELMERIRQMSLSLRPPMLDDLGLLATLEWHFKRYTKQTGMQVHFQASGLQGRLASAVETAAYRLVQEALTNVARYARVTEVQVDIRVDPDGLSIRVEDHGAGFDAQAVLAEGSSTGLSGMRERVHLLEGEFKVDSAAGRGTRIAIRLPLLERERGSSDRA